METQALEGVKILDFCWAYLGPLSTRHLANHGAQVIRVESRSRLGPARGDRQTSKLSASNVDERPLFTFLNTSKYGMTVDLKHPKAMEVMTRLIQWADVVIENYTPGTMSRMGLGYEHISKIKPDIIMVGASVYGQTGPLGKQWGVDGTGNSLSGRYFLAGWPDSGPVMPTSILFGDVVTPFFVGSAIVAALDYKRRTGKGQYIDVSMLEVCANQITPVILDWEANANLQTRTGNRVPNAAPHGVFPCLGDDRWCAISVFTDEEWQSFCQVIGSPDWTKDSKFVTLDSRKKNEDELEKLVAKWTVELSAEEVMQLMQDGGIAAGVVQNSRDLVENDPQLKEREFLIPLEHPVLGKVDHPTPPFKLLKTRAKVKTSPCLGEHTEYVCTELLGMTDQEFVTLLGEKCFE
jgi:crotonobetainyl-CoA:carnitine CoA-transferase CaiB-like acyl-CoA transferase